jgi:hypothetical protein
VRNQRDITSVVRPHCVGSVYVQKATVQFVWYTVYLTILDLFCVLYATCNMTEACLQMSAVHFAVIVMCNSILDYMWDVCKSSTCVTQDIGASAVCKNATSPHQYDLLHNPYLSHHLPFSALSFPVPILSYSTLSQSL